MLDTPPSGPPPCRGLTGLFFSEARGDQERAKALCAGCADREWCAERALQARATAGVWGGIVFEPNFRRNARLAKAAATRRAV